jgi:response regulator RpfG family c-di-GMP phosphodiesterase
VPTLSGQSSQHDPVSERKLRALVVDDEPDIRLMLDLFLRNAGYAVITAPSVLCNLSFFVSDIFRLNLLVMPVQLGSR